MVRHCSATGATAPPLPAVPGPCPPHAPGQHSDRGPLPPDRAAPFDRGTCNDAHQRFAMPTSTVAGPANTLSAERRNPSPVAPVTPSNMAPVVRGVPDRTVASHPSGDGGFPLLGPRNRSVLQGVLQIALDLPRTGQMASRWSPCGRWHRGDPWCEAFRRTGCKVFRDEDYKTAAGLGKLMVRSPRHKQCGWKKNLIQPAAKLSDIPPKK